MDARRLGKKKQMWTSPPWRNFDLKNKKTLSASKRRRRPNCRLNPQKEARPLTIHCVLFQSNASAKSDFTPCISAQSQILVLCVAPIIFSLLPNQIIFFTILKFTASMELQCLNEYKFYKFWNWLLKWDKKRKHDFLLFIYIHIYKRRNAEFVSAMKKTWKISQLWRKQTSSYTQSYGKEAPQKPTVQHCDYIHVLFCCLIKMTHVGGLNLMEHFSNEMFSWKVLVKELKKLKDFSTFILIVKISTFSFSMFSDSTSVE